MKKENLRSKLHSQKWFCHLFHTHTHTHTKTSRMIKNHEQIPAVNTLIEIKYTTHSK